MVLFVDRPLKQAQTEVSRM
uniref:Uncharacterized protein n=1 Tax=Rhizophora mucronata TaxID=61149 RepID=A0A2P2PB58_RHIMU